ncbi:MAG: transposase [Cuspidothrix sp.]
MNFQLLRNSFVIGSMGLGLTGFFALFTPYQQFSQFLISAGLGSLGSSSLAIRESEKISNKKRKKLLNDIAILQADISHFSKLLQDKHIQLECAIIERDNAEECVSAFRKIIDLKESELAATKEALNDSRDVNFNAAVITLKESLEEVRGQINNLVPYLVKKFNVDVSSLLTEFNQDCCLITKQIAVITDNTKLTNEQLIAACLAIQHSILNKGLSLKAKLYKAALDNLQKQFCNVIPVSDHNQQIKQLREEYLKNIKAIHQEFNSVADGVISNYKSDFSEIVNDGLSQSRELETLQNQIHSLNSKLQDLSKPLQFVGTSEAARVGNSIIIYYHQKLGITLDAIDFNSTSEGYKLLFHLSRNNRFIPTDTLNDGNNPDKIKELSGSLNSPKFSQSERSNYVSLDIELRKPARKETSKDDVNSIWITKDKFESHVKRWERVRITAGSTGGKSPTAKNLALAIMSSRQGVGEIKLYDPQDGSKKDFWDMPKAGCSHDDSVKGMKELVTILDARSANPGKHKFTLYLFDEIDSTLAKYKGETKFKDLVVYAISQGSHQDLGMIFIGQSCDANTVPGMTHSHWNNCVQLHIGSNAGLYLDKATTITTEDKNRLLNQYRKIQEFCDSENERLGLDIYSDPGAYRFALAVPLSGLPKFIQLPDFDSYNYYEVMKDESEITCIHCTSSNVKKNGKLGDKQRYKCGDCGKSFNV